MNSLFKRLAAYSILAISCAQLFGQSGKFVNSVNTIAELVAQNPSGIYTNVFVAGRQTPGDGGDGLFTLARSSSASTNLGTILPTSTGTGRWLRQFDGSNYELAWFKTGTGDYYAALTNALATASTKTLNIPIGTFTVGTTVNLTSLLASGTTIRGNGSVSTILSFTGSGFLFDLDGTASLNSVRMEGFSVTSVASGIRLGRIATAYNANQQRDNWIFRDLYVTGPGATTAGSVGLSLTQLGASRFDTMRVSSFETGIQMYSTTEINANLVDVVTFKDGIDYNVASGAPSGGAQDTWTLLRIHGPTVAGGRCVYMNQQSVVFTGSYMEQFSANTGRAFIEFGGNGRNFLSLGNRYDLSAGSMTNFLYFGTNTDGSISVRNTFIGDRAGGAMPTNNIILAPSGPGGVDTHLAVGCNDHFNTAFKNYLTLSGYVSMIGHTNAGPFVLGRTRTGPLFVGDGAAPGTLAQFNGLDTGGVFDIKLTAASTWRFLNAAYTLVNLSLDDSGNGTFRGNANAQGGQLGLGVANVKLVTGTGTPEAVVTADPGAIFMRNDGLTGRTIYIKQTGSGTTTGWRYPYDAVIRNPQAGAYQILISDYYVLSTGTSAKTLPDASDVGAGKVIIVKSAATFTTTVTASGGDTVEGAATDVLGSLASGYYISDGVTNWEKN